MVEWLECLFPRLVGTAYRITSPPTDKYNCVAWAVGVTDAWWWLVSYHGRPVHWPAGIACEETVEAFRSALDAIGFVRCDGEHPEAGYEKVALFADAQQTPTHIARQLTTGYWTSKLGQADDIEHELRALEGDIYGIVVLVMQRPLAGPTAPSM